MGGGTGYNKSLEDGENVAPTCAYETDCRWRPFTLRSLPAENVVVLVRYRAEAMFTGVSHMGSTVSKHRVYPALPVYSRAPYSRDERMFRGLVVLQPRQKEAAGAFEYMDGDVVDAFDAWMPCPS